MRHVQRGPEPPDLTAFKAAANADWTPRYRETASPRTSGASRPRPTTCRIETGNWRPSASLSSACFRATPEPLATKEASARASPGGRGELVGRYRLPEEPGRRVGGPALYGWPERDAHPLAPAPPRRIAAVFSLTPAGCAENCFPRRVSARFFRVVRALSAGVSASRTRSGR